MIFLILNLSLESSFTENPSGPARPTAHHFSGTQQGVGGFSIWF